MYQRSFTVLVLTFALVCVHDATAAADDLPHLDERTALMIGAKRLRIGILSFDYGIIEQVPIPNFRLKVSILQRGPVAVAVQDGVPASGFGSFRVHQRVWPHGELTYIFANPSGDGDVDNAGLQGDAATRAARAEMILELRLAFKSGSMLDPYTNVTIDGQVLQRIEHPWEAVAEASFPTARWR